MLDFTGRLTRYTNVLAVTAALQVVLLTAGGYCSWVAAQAARDAAKTASDGLTDSRTESGKTEKFIREELDDMKAHVNQMTTLAQSTRDQADTSAANLTEAERENHLTDSRSEESLSASGRQLKAATNLATSTSALADATARTERRAAHPLLLVSFLPRFGFQVLNRSAVGAQIKFAETGDCNGTSPNPRNIKWSLVDAPLYTGTGVMGDPMTGPQEWNIPKAAAHQIGAASIIVSLHLRYSNFHGDDYDLLCSRQVLPSGSIAIPPDPSFNHDIVVGHRNIE